MKWINEEILIAFILLYYLVWHCSCVIFHRRLGWSVCIKLQAMENATRLRPKPEERTDGFLFSAAPALLTTTSSSASTVGPSAPYRKWGKPSGAPHPFQWPWDERVRMSLWLSDSWGRWMMRLTAHGNHWSYWLAGASVGWFPASLALQSITSMM